MKIGIDIVEVKRMNDINELNRLKKIFTQNEINYFYQFQNPLVHIAGCFCAKEAFAKALKIGFGSDLAPIDIEILHYQSGAPYINLQNLKLKNLLTQNEKVDISISHCDEFAVAECLIYE